jgi:hypothetical protein
VEQAPRACGARRDDWRDYRRWCSDEEVARQGGGTGLENETGG